MRFWSEEMGAKDTYFELPTICYMIITVVVYDNACAHSAIKWDGVALKLRKKRFSNLLVTQPEWKKVNADDADAIKKNVDGDREWETS